MHDSKQDQQEEMTAERREKLMGRIKKCLALGSSPEPHEAAAAMRQAQKLMEQLGVTEDEVEGLAIGEATVKTREGFGACRYMSHLCDVTQMAFGVKAIFTKNPGSANRLNVRYVGSKPRVQLAEYAHRVMQKALEEAWAKYLETHDWRKGKGGVRQAFYIGWLDKVRAQVVALAPTEKETALTERHIERTLGVLTTNASKKSKLDYAALNAGRQAAGDFALHRPLEEDQLKLENK